jgi:uncharacterized membrane protein YhiD involved in acid resistance
VINMGQKKNFKYYLMIFGIAVLAILIYVVINWISSGILDTAMFWSALFLPLLFTLFLFVFDKIFDKLFPKKRSSQGEKDGFNKFVNILNASLDKNGEFSIQDYRTLQDSERFQKTLKQLYTIKTNGETEDLTIDYLSKKFKKTTVEYKAVQIIVEELKKMD